MKYENLIFIRNRLGLSQRSIAQRLKVSKSTYARWETGEKIIPLNHLIDLCNLANVSVDYVLGLTDVKSEFKNIRLNKKNIGNKLTQGDLARSINTTQSVISAYENGLVTIQTAFLYEICIKYHVSADIILK